MDSRWGVGVLLLRQQNFITFGTHVRHKDRVLRVQEDCSMSIIPLFPLRCLLANIVYNMKSRCYAVNQPLRITSEPAPLDAIKVEDRLG